MRNRSRYQLMGGQGVAVLLAASWTGVGALQLDREAVQIDSDDLGGVVTSAKGPEAGGPARS